MTQFILNENEVITDQPPGMVMLDFIRYHQQLCGTKIGCREGDCGACTVLVGEPVEGRIVYHTVTSCLMPLQHAQGRHIVTIEGINLPGGLNKVQQAMVDESATQCGFCTPGFVLSLAGFCLSAEPATDEKAVAAVDGNICRCTGYKSIQRAAGRLAELMEGRANESPVDFACQQQIVPEYFNSIAQRLAAINRHVEKQLPSLTASSRVVGGGTDLYVQRPEEMHHVVPVAVSNQPSFASVRQEGVRCLIDASATVQDLASSPVMQKAFPELARYIKLVSSTPIRNMATVAGNFVNASPIGDLSIFFLALDATLHLQLEKGKEVTRRTLPLRQFFRGYKQLDLLAAEVISEISFPLPGSDCRFHFEKVSKRTHLDIASVNTAMMVKREGNQIIEAGLAAGGLAPVPLYFGLTSEWLKGQTIVPELLEATMNKACEAISPISDARGSKAYKTLLFRQLIKTHFLTLFPDIDWPL